MKNLIYLFALIFSGLLISCMSSHKQEFPKYQERYTNIVNELDSVKVYFDNFHIDSASYYIRMIDSMCQNVNCDSLKQTSLEFKELDAIDRFFNYYLDQYSALKKELVSSYEHLEFIKISIEEGNYSDSIVQVQFDYEEKLIQSMELDFNIKFKDLQNYYSNYTNRFELLMGLMH